MPVTADTVPQHLQALRERARVPLKTLAHEMGYKGPSSIQRYFDPQAYKGGFLRRDIVEKFARVLTRYGISREEVWELAGPEFVGGGKADPEVAAKLLRLFADVLGLNSGHQAQIAQIVEGLLADIQSSPTRAIMTKHVR